MNPDSIYKPIERTAKKFDEIYIPKKLEASLPFANKHKDDTKGRKESYLSKRAVSFVL